MTAEGVWPCQVAHTCVFGGGQLKESSGEVAEQVECEKRVFGAVSSLIEAFQTRRAAVSAGALAVAVVGMLPSSAAQSHSPRDAVRKGMERLLQDDRFPAALAATVDRDGHTQNYTTGVADLKTMAKVPVDGQIRAGSNTKTFTATVVLQLVGEGEVALDAPIEKYLPDLVRGEGIDGHHITVRQLLQHTSGLPDYTNFLGEEAIFGTGRHTYYQPRTLLDVALAHKAEFAPGTNWSYSNTNYVLAGLLIEKVTGRPVAERITHRVIDRIGLRHTYFPSTGDERIRDAHPKGYSATKPGAPLEDITRIDPSWAWSAGQLISTPSDLNRFFSALIGGELLGPNELAQMRTTVKVADTFDSGSGIRFGLGLTSTPLSCGGLMWGHRGDTPGYHTRTGATDDGRAATIATTARPAPTSRGLNHADATPPCARDNGRRARAADAMRGVWPPAPAGCAGCSARAKIRTRGGDRRVHRTTVSSGRDGPTASLRFGRAGKASRVAADVDAAAVDGGGSRVCAVCAVRPGGLPHLVAPV